MSWPGEFIEWVLAMAIVALLFAVCGFVWLITERRWERRHPLQEPLAGSREITQIVNLSMIIYGEVRPVQELTFVFLDEPIEGPLTVSQADELIEALSETTMRCDEFCSGIGGGTANGRECTQIDVRTKNEEPRTKNQEHAEAI